MRRVLCLFSLLFLEMPRLAIAIQLHWAGGATNLTVSSNTQAVLVVQADSAEVALPNTWRLQWTADSLRVQFSAFDPNQACLVDTAKVDSIAPPSTPADSAANQVTAYFCSDGRSNAGTARFLADLPGAGHGKMKVVALNPVDTTQVVVSNEVTFNGGTYGDYAPTILRTSVSHESIALTVVAVGTGLSMVRSASIAATTLGSVGLRVVDQSDNAITVAGSVS